VDGVLSAERRAVFEEALESMGAEDDGGDWVVAVAKGWRSVQGLLDDEPEEPGSSDQRLMQGAEVCGMRHVPTHLDANFAQNLYKRGQYLAH